MKIYLVELYYGLDYESDYFKILGVYDSKAKAETLKEEYLHSETYERLNHEFDYLNVYINEYNLNEKCYEY